ncbi:transposase [Micromonospora auratinigra]|uniref:transposase n=1 Tax=Micromonospora auratinigra TaxID=261654 RepID=UPI0018D41612|nr:transposase [Micromonospora auratinigra]
MSGGGGWLTACGAAGSGATSPGGINHQINIDRVRSEPAWARLCGVAPLPASSGMTARRRLDRGGRRQADAALCRAVIVRVQHHEPTRACAARRAADGKTEAEIVRCLERLVAREIWALLRPLRTITMAT